jgi:short-subunit dehydrogenase
MNYQGLTALVTGASSGLGEEFARQLSTLGANVVLVARSGDKLHLLADTIRTKGNTQVTVMPVDLSSADAVRRFVADVRERGIEIDILINNAGLGLFKNFLDTPLDGQIEQIDVNVCAVVTLTHTPLHRGWCLEGEAAS